MTPDEQACFESEMRDDSDRRAFQRKRKDDVPEMQLHLGLAGPGFIEVVSGPDKQR